MKAKTTTTSVNLLHELERADIRWIASGDDEIKICCPAHGETSPSCALNTKTHLWTCYVPSCKAKGDLIALLSFKLKAERKIILADLQTRYPEMSGISEIPSQTVEKFRASIKDAGPLIKALYERAISDDMIRKARIGFYDGRLTIPIFDDHNRCINVRRYLPGAPGPKKMRNTTGHGAPALYRTETITDTTKLVVICGGELKALLVGSVLAEHEIAGVASTGGEGSWHESWTKKLKDRHVCIMMDIDNAGNIAAKRIAIQLFQHVKSLKILKLPLDETKHPKGDVNDWFGAEGATKDDLIHLIKETPVWTPPNVAPSDQTQVETTDKSLETAFSSASVGSRVRVDAVVAACDETPFLVPRTLKVECTRDQPGCMSCPVHVMSPDAEGYVDLRVEAASSAVLGMVSTSKKDQHFKMQEALSIPRCKTVQFHVQDHHTVYDVRISPPIDLTGGRVSDNWFPALLVSEEKVVDLNTPCSMVGSVYPHPNTQQATALIDSYTELEDSLSSFKCDDTQLQSLKRVFQPGEGQSVAEKLDELYTDLETNVTWIYERRDMHLALDLAWHSPLMFKFGGRVVNGWLNLCVIGDSAQGKSEATQRLLTHYGVGDKMDCKNATVAGLLGGLEQLGNRWFVRWGAIPTRDRALVILEELKGMPAEVMAKLTDMRSSGIAEIPKIERRRAMARTRIIAISNPRSPRPMNSYHFGVQAIHELVGNLEDVRRFDLAIAVAKGEVRDEVINRMPSATKKVPNYATSEHCRRLVLWAWTRTPEQIHLDPDTTDRVVQVANLLSKKYDEKIPLVDQGTMRHKVARMACALAARVFSSPDGKVLAVRPEHVDYVSTFIQRIYDSPAMGYAAFSEAERAMSQLREPKMIEKAIRKTKFPIDLCELLLVTDQITDQDLISAASDMDTGRQLLSLFVRKGALLRTGRNVYVKNAQFIELLRVILNSDARNQHDTEGDDF